MFNGRIKNRLTCLENYEVNYGTRIDKLEKEIRQLKCEHRAVVFKEPPIATMNSWAIWISGISSPQEPKTPYAKECATCGKILKYYKTKKAWLEAQLKEERKKKTTGKGKKKTTKKAKKRVAPRKK